MDWYKKYQVILDISKAAITSVVKERCYQTIIEYEPSNEIFSVKVDCGLGLAQD